mmetsp:Transcript_27267/g.80196  ORF Transcript_27267/g.80196 Transcript_27267/m.80196 type:complete len:221 (+) Transcript_27267:252-914(+)
MRFLSLGSSSKVGASRSCWDQFSGRCASILYCAAWNSISSRSIQACSWWMAARAANDLASARSASFSAGGTPPTFLAGLPDQISLAGTVVFAGSTEPAVSTAPLPIAAPAETMQPQPMCASSPTEALSMMLPAPMVTSLPTLTGALPDAVRVAFSCTELISPMLIGAPCARITAPYHTDAPALRSTAPVSVALGATKLWPMVGALPATFTAVHGTGSFSS